MRDSDAPWFVYFVQPLDGGPIKIGTSREPQSRITGLMAWSPFRLQMLATAPGGRAEESWLHQRFAEHRSHGEWFAPVPDLLAFIGQVQKTGVLGIGKVLQRPNRHPDRQYPSIITLLRDRGLKSADLAAYLGIGRTNFSAWITNGVPDRHLLAVVRFFGERGKPVTAEELFDWKPGGLEPGYRGLVKRLTHSAADLRLMPLSLSDDLQATG